MIPDIYQDSRIPHDAYRPTFVRSLVMVPIRSAAPIGAIGNYWATHHECTAEELMLLEALANTTAVAMENVNVYQSLESQVLDRTRELEYANQELEAFSAAVSHDLRAPLRLMNAVLGITSGEEAGLPTSSVSKLRRCTERMGSLIEDLLRLSKVGRTQLDCVSLDLGEMTTSILSRMAASEPERTLDMQVDAPAIVSADRALMGVVLENLLSNAWKYTSKQEVARISFTSTANVGGKVLFCCSDNGAGFEPGCTDQLFKPFMRLHDERQFPGIGIGLATVKRIIQRHGGAVWGESDGRNGARFWFTLEPVTRRVDPV